MDVHGSILLLPSLLTVIFWIPLKSFMYLSTGPSLHPDPFSLLPKHVVYLDLDLHRCGPSPPAAV